MIVLWLVRCRETNISSATETRDSRMISAAKGSILLLTATYLLVLAVRFECRSFADVALFDVLQHTLARPLARITPATAGTGDQTRDVAPAQMDASTFAEPIWRAAVGTDDLNVVWRTALSPRDTPRRELGAAECRGEEHPLLAQDPIVAHQAKPAAELPSARVHRVQRVLVDYDSVLLLADLGRDDVCLAVADADEARFAVFVDAGTPTARLRLDQDGQLPCVGVDTGQDEPAGGQEMAGRDAIRHVRRKGLPDQVCRVEHRFPVCRDRCRAHCREDVAFRADDLERSDAAFIHGRVRVGQRLEDGPHPAHQTCPCAVDRAARLRARSREVGDELVVCDRHLDLDRDRVGGESVIVDEVLGFEDAFG